MKDFPAQIKYRYKMNMVRYFFLKPYLVLIAMLTAYFALPSNYALIIVPALLLTSIVLMIREKRWDKLLTLSVTTFTVTVILLIFGYLTSKIFEPTLEITDDDFYSREFKDKADLKLPSALKLLSKTDSVIILFNGDFFAECIYEGPEKSIMSVEREIRSKKEFIKESENNYTKQSSPDSRYFGKAQLASIYEKNEEGRYLVKIAFDKSHTRMYFSVSQY
jgi:multisubunit Na+/H+ antiporter MnhC subunit